jgi:hypothetical protein
MSIEKGQPIVSVWSHTVSVMGHRLIPIHNAAAAPCAGCHTSSGGPVCRADLGEPCLSPELQGPSGTVQQVMTHLQDAWCAEIGLPASGLVRSLTLTADEADLTLTCCSQGPGARLADVAFQTMRRLLPNTDIYVRCT